LNGFNGEKPFIADCFKPYVEERHTVSIFFFYFAEKYEL